LQLPWWLAPLAEVKRRALGKHISEHLRQIVRRKFNELQLDSSSIGSRTILALSLKEVEHLTPAILEETCDQLKTFLFAGHDTTSTLLGWMCYELSRTPRSLRAVHEELDQLFGPETEPRAIREKLLAPGGDELLGRMTYCSAVIKEILRLHPPAGSIRMTKPGTGLTVSTPQGSYNIDGTYIYINHTIIQRDRAVFGETADSFVPERWLGSSEIPVSAWRPFERGPRNCIGQELANIEARIIIALVARRYDFKKVGLGELEYDENGKTMLDDKTGQFQVKTELYSVSWDLKGIQLSSWADNC
jgi:cytochrome P450